MSSFVYSHCGGGDGLLELVSDICRSGIPCIGPTVLALSALVGVSADGVCVLCLSTSDSRNEGYLIASGGMSIYKTGSSAYRKVERQARSALSRQVG